MSVKRAHRWRMQTERVPQSRDRPRQKKSTTWRCTGANRVKSPPKADCKHGINLWCEASRKPMSQKVTEPVGRRSMCVGMRAHNRVAPRREKTTIKVHRDRKKHPKHMDEENEKKWNIEKEGMQLQSATAVCVLRQNPSQCNRAHVFCATSPRSKG